MKKEFDLKMMENKKSTVQIENLESFNLKQILECGQCFRWNKQEDCGSYGGVVTFFVDGKFISTFVQAKQEGEKLSLLSSKEIIKSKWENYFDLKTDYKTIKKNLGKNDLKIKEAIKAGEGIRILNQDKWETLVSFIISQNNNIPRIKGCIEALCQKFGEPLGHFAGTNRYGFPSPQILANLNVEDLGICKLGYRAPYIIEASKQILDMGLEEYYRIDELPEEEAFQKLTSLKGVGPKVAHCLLLFAFQKRKSFPIDVWIKKVMKDVYGLEEKKEIETFAKEKFGENGGIAQQYLFYYIRELERKGE